MREFAEYGLQGLPSDVRNQIASKDYIDVDFNNCGFRLMRDMMKSAGLPCPNIFAGGHNFHGRYEYVPLESILSATKVICEIAKLTQLKYA